MSFLVDDHVQRLFRHLEVVDPEFHTHNSFQANAFVSHRANMEAKPSWVLQVVLEAVAQEAMPDTQNQCRVVPSVSDAVEAVVRSVESEVLSPGLPPLASVKVVKDLAFVKEP